MFTKTSAIQKRANIQQQNRTSLPKGRASFTTNSGNINRKAFSMSQGTPEIRDPMFNPETFYLSNDVRTLNRWIRYYDTFHPILPNSLDIHAYFPISDFSFKGVNDTFISGFYDYIKNEKLKLLDWIILASREYEALGEVFTFFGWDTYNGYFNSATVLNPDLLDIYPYDFEGGRKYIISMDIPQALEKLNRMKDTDMRYRTMWNNLDPIIKKCVVGGLKIPLSPNNVFGMQRLAFAYDVRGTSQVLRCFTKGTKVFIEDGTAKAINEIKKGESCWTVEGQLSEVTDTIETEYAGEMIKIYTGAEETPIECTADHKFPVYMGGRYCVECGKELTFKQYKKGQKVCSRTCNALNSSIFRKIKPEPIEREKIIWKEAGELKKGDILLTARQKQFQSTPENICEEKARLLGYFLAEGSYQKTRHGKYSGITFAFCSDELDTWIKDVQSILKETYGIASVLHKDKENCIKIMSLCSETTTELVEWLQKMAGEYSHSKKLNAEIMKWPLRLQEQILIGFCRGDGSISTYPELSCCTVSENLAYQLSKIATNLGLPHRFKINTPKSEKKRLAYWLLFPGSINEIFINKCYPYRNKKYTEGKLEIVNLILDLQKEKHSYAEIVEILNEKHIKKENGEKWDAVTVGNICRKKVYGIQGQGKHTHFSVTDDYILIPIEKIEKYDYKGKVYCVTVADKTHSISLRSVCTKNCLKDLMHEDKLREAQMAVADGHITPMQIWKLGSVEKGYVPTADELADFQDMLQQGEHQNLFRIVTHDAVTYETKGVQEGLLPITPELEAITERILIALYTSRGIVSGEGPSWSASVMAMKVLEGRYQNKLYRLANIIKGLYKKIAIANDFYKATEAEVNHKVYKGKSDRELIIPEIHWENYFSFAKDLERAKFYLQLAQAHKVSYQRLFEILGLDPKEEEELIRKEMKSLYSDDVWNARVQQIVEQMGGEGGGGNTVGKGTPTNMAEAPEGGGGASPVEEVGAEIPEGAGAPPLARAEEQLGAM